VPIQPANRNYLGCKQKLVPQLAPLIQERLGTYGTLFDPFAGTGCLPYALATRTNRIILVDQLKSCQLPLSMFFKRPPSESGNVILDAMACIDILNEQIEDISPEKTYIRGYVAFNFGDKYFSMANAMKIDHVREAIAEVRNQWVKDYCMTSLLYALDKISWTFGHYDAFKKQEKTKNQAKLKLEKLDLTKQMHENNLIWGGDALHALQNVAHIIPQVTFLDPPYNTRQYGANYHLLENLVEGDDPECFGYTAKYKEYPRSMWSTKIAAEVFSDFIERLNTRHIIMTYNNQPDNLITANQIVDAFEKKGRLEIMCFDKQIITTGLSDARGNKELVYICEVK
jgi:adenine-specific DNA-methyltransferase